eukprot:15218-Heterococcus_DN1.PRE.1
MAPCKQQHTSLLNLERAAGVRCEGQRADCGWAQGKYMHALYETLRAMFCFRTLYNTLCTVQPRATILPMLCSLAVMQ